MANKDNKVTDGTQNFYSSTLRNMEEHYSELSKKNGDRVPYHLQYIRQHPDAQKKQQT